MRALILASGGVISAKIVSKWISIGNSVAALWLPGKTAKRASTHSTMLGRVAPPWSISAIIRRHNVPAETSPPLSDRSELDSRIKQLNADVLITAMTHQIVPDFVLERFPGRAVNFHPAILPHYRGPNPRSGMILDHQGALFGGITLHELSCRIDRGDIIGRRVVPYDPEKGFIQWDVRQARAAADLVKTELQAYLRGTLTPETQSFAAGSYRRVRSDELFLTEDKSAGRMRWLCEELGPSGWIKHRSGNAGPETCCTVYRYIGQLGPRTGQAPRITRFAIEFDAADARVRVRRISWWTELTKMLNYLCCIKRTSPRKLER